MTFGYHTCISLERFSNIGKKGKCNLISYYMHTFELIFHGKLKKTNTTVFIIIRTPLLLIFLLFLSYPN